MKNFHASTHSHYSRVLTRFFLAALFFSVILFSCKDEKIEPPVSSLSAEEKNTIPNLRKGIQILSFENLKQFQDTFYELSGSDLKRKEFLQNSKSSEFKSLKGYYDSIELSEIEDLMKNKEKLQASKSLISIINNGDSTISYRV
ncbi:MAG: hypothetical protein K9I26_06770, partial [Flavobacterium sp.]|nr:hypothetical protein [Flavobacterium sp.]